MLAKIKNNNNAVHCYVEGKRGHTNVADARTLVATVQYVASLCAV